MIIADQDSGMASSFLDYCCACDSSSICMDFRYNVEQDEDSEKVE